MKSRPSPGAGPARGARGNAARRRAPRSFGGGWARDVAVLAVGGLIVAALALLLQSRWDDGLPGDRQPSGVRAVTAIAEIHADGALRINEIMTANRDTLAAGDGSSPDWVEVCNQGDRAVQLRGYALAKTDSGAGVFAFPEMSLEPGACALVYADSRLRAEAGKPLHAPFRLSSAGDTLMLFNPSGAAVDTVNIPALPADQSYVRVDRETWTVSADATPGLPNAPESVLSLSRPGGEGDVVLSELVASNDATLVAEDGLYYDYIELHNRSGAAVELEGWYLSDDALQPRKWRFPAVRVEADGYLVVYASGLNRVDDPEHLHTNFSLSSEGEQLVLCDAQGRMLECVEYGLLKRDQAWSRASDGSWRSATPTPGMQNG